jgi:beta-lactamase class A
MLALIVLSLPTIGQNALLDSIQRIETGVGGRIGVAVRDLGSGAEWRYKAGERFPLSSTFKALLCGAVLAKVDTGTESLDRRVPYHQSDLVDYSPITEQHTDIGMTVSELCEAAVAISDNTAGNLLLETVGGPAGFTKFLRGIGDEVSRLDRWETDLNEGLPGDARDTTTPDAIINTLEELVFGDTLSGESKHQLSMWMAADQVADDLLRVSLPAGWTIADKSGAGGYGSRSIIAVIWPPDRAPVLAAIYLTETEAEFRQRNAAIAEVGSAIFEAVLGN